MNDVKGVAFGYVLSSKWTCVSFSRFFFNERASQWADFLATVIGVKGSWKREKRLKYNLGEMLGRLLALSDFKLLLMEFIRRTARNGFLLLACNCIAII